MKEHIRYYNFWDKKISRCEKKHKSLECCYVKQIERSYNMGMINLEQYNELTERALKTRNFYC